jgi:hypothetical protein
MTGESKQVKGHLVLVALVNSINRQEYLSTYLHTILVIFPEIQLNIHAQQTTAP